MKPEFWHERWQKNNIGFHEEKPNDLLTRYFDHLNLNKGSRIFLPLCGKTRDIDWLLSKGYQIVGIELSELAINQLFEELGIEPKISKEEKLIHYTSEGLNIFAGNFFDLTREQLQLVDAIYDRAALVALPEDMRIRYTSHLRTITNNVIQLLITFEYDQAQMEGPPFSISGEEVDTHYSNVYKITKLEERAVEGELKKKIDAIEHAWLLET